MKPAMTNLSPQPRIEEAILDDCEGVFTQSDKAGHPRLAVLEGAKAWVAGPGPAMTQWERPCRVLHSFNAYEAALMPMGCAGPSRATASGSGGGHPGTGRSGLATETERAARKRL